MKCLSIPCIKFDQRTILLSKISDIVISDVSVLPNDHLKHTILYGNNMYNDKSNKMIIEPTIHFINKTVSFKKLEAFSY